MKIVFMERDSLGHDVTVGKFKSLGEVEIFGKSSPSENASRIKDADIVIVSYGAPVRSVVEAVRRCDRKVGYIKIDTPWPFPDEQIAELTANAKDVLVVEMNLGQMYYEVDRACKKNSNVHLLGVIGGLLPTPDEILEKIDEIGGN